MIAFDTETQDGRAILLVTPDRYHEPKSWEDVIRFLNPLGARGVEYIAWNSDYDAQAILKWLPQWTLNLIDEQGYACYRDWVIKFVPSKFCRIWVRDEVTDKRKLIVTIYDLRQFYACSLDHAAKKLKLPRKKEIPKTWYKCMGERLRDPRTRQRVIDYALQDARTLQAILDRTETAFRAANLDFIRPISNASFSERYFANELRDPACKVSWARQQHAYRSYHGGRIECLHTGYYPQAWHIDLHSAYPSAIAELEATDGRWYEGKRVREDLQYAAVLATVHIPEGWQAGPIPVESREGVIYYPVGTVRLMLTLSEFRWLDARSCIVKVHQVFGLHWGSHRKPFHEIANLYRKRQENPAMSYALKIVMNALYGKFAQTQSVWTPTRYIDRDAVYRLGAFYRKRQVPMHHTNFFYAAEITSRIRLRVYEEVPHDRVIFYATDGVMMTAPYSPTKTGDGLGEWSYGEDVENLIVVGSGVYQYDYWTDDERVRVAKFRGFNTRLNLSYALQQAGPRHSVSFKLQRNVSLRQSFSPDDFNVISEVTRKLNVNFDSKRVWPVNWTARELLGNQYSSEPWVYVPKFIIREDSL